MKSTNAEQLLWELSRCIGDADETGIDAGQLAAYRDALLDDDEVKRVETALAHCATSRRRLAELGNVTPGLPPARVRAAVLGKPRMSGAGWKVAAALLIAAFALPLLWPQFDAGRAPGDPAPPPFDVRVEALAQIRSGAAGDVLAYPDTPVRIVAEARHAAKADLAYAVYRLEDDRLVRLSDPMALQIQTYRGAAQITVSAAQLAGPAPGRYPFFLVVAAADSLPAHELSLSRQDPLKELAGAGRRVYALSLTLLEAARQ